MKLIGLLVILTILVGGGVWGYLVLKGGGDRSAGANPDYPHVRIENFVKVDDGLFRGAQPDQAGYDDLQALGIRTIACLRVSDDHCEIPQYMAFRTHHISFKHIHPEDEDVRKWLAIVKDKTSRPIYVHCRQGVDRTGMMVAIYRIVVQDWTKKRAIAEMKMRGFNKWNLPIERYLEDLDTAKWKAYLVE